MDGKHMGGTHVLLGEGMNWNVPHELQYQTRNNTHIFLNTEIEMSVLHPQGKLNMKVLPRDEGKETLWTTSKRHMEKGATTNLK